MTPDQLAEALGLADAAATAREAAAVLRARLAPLKVVAIDPLDVRGESPAAVGARRALYLGAHDGHCWRLTADAGQAAGVFVADRG